MRRDIYTMHIVHFSWEYPPVLYGGLGTFATEITQEQKKAGNNITVFSLNENNKYAIRETWRDIQVYRPKLVDGAPTFRLYANPELLNWGANIKFFSDVVNYNTLSASQLTNELVRSKKNHFDIIDAHDWLGIIGGMIAHKELDLPLIFHVHSTEVGRSAGDGSQIIKNIELEGGETADCIITVSHAMHDELVHLGYPKDKIRVCWNGIDPHKYDPAQVSSEKRQQIREQYGITNNETFLFFIGRLVTVKGPDNLIKAMPSVLEEFPRAKLVLLGIGDMENHLNNLIDELQLDKQVILRTEFVSEQERIAHYAASDIVVLPSLYEPFGIVCTEAMSMAKPVVVGARGVNGMREQIIKNGDGQCGVHINPFDPADIAWGLKQMLALSPSRRTQLGINGRKRAQQHFSWKKVTKKTLEIYKEFA